MEEGAGTEGAALLPLSGFHAGAFGLQDRTLATASFRSFPQGQCSSHRRSCLFPAQRVPEIISRTKRIEEQLRAREELNASAQRQQAAAAAAEMAAESGSANRRRESSLNVADSREDGRWITSSQSQKRLSAHVESNSSTWRSGPSPPPSPSPSPSPPITTPRSETPVLIDEKEPAKPPNDAASGPVATPVTSLADRLNALRGAGLSTSLVNSKRMNETYGGSRNLSALAEDDEVSGAHHDPGAGSKDGVDLATGPGTAGPALDAAPQVDIEQERPGSAPSELTHPPGKPRLPEDDRQLPADSHMPPSMTGANQENPAVDPQSFASPPLPTHAAFSIHHAISAPPHGDFADDEAMNQRFPHVPSPSEFESSYPALDTWERDTRFPSAPSHLPGNQAQQTGGGSGSGPRRPLPPPPAPPSDVDLGRSDVPHPFPERVSASAPKPAYTPSSGSADAATSKRSSVAVPTALRPGTTPPVPGASGYPKPAPARPTQVSSAASGEPVPTSGRSKPPLPFSNHVTVEDLWAYLNPTFESVTDADGSTRLVKRPAHSVLLLDLRSREEFEQGRIKAADVVCLEPITIKTG